MTARRIRVRKAGGWWYWDCPDCGIGLSLACGYASRLAWGYASRLAWATASEAVDAAIRHHHIWHA